MQGKGLIKFFVIALIVICLFQLMFSVVAWRVEKKADSYAIEKVLPEGKDTSTLAPDEKADLKPQLELQRKRFIDSVAKENVIDLPGLKFTYDDVRKQQIKLGLDLKGGVSMVLQVSEEDILKAMSNHSKDSIFNLAIRSAKARQSQTTKGFVEIFGEEYEKLAPQGKLAGIFSTIENKDKISASSTNEEVLKQLQDQAKATVSMVFSTVRSRIDAFGIVAPNMSMDERTGRIFIEMPGVDNPADARKLVTSTAKLEFWETYQAGDIVPMLDKANRVLAGIMGLTDSNANDTAKGAEADSSNALNALNNPQDSTTKTKVDSNALTALNDSPKTAAVDTDSTGLGGTSAVDSVKEREKFFKENPLRAKLQFPINQQGQVASPNSAMVGYARGTDRALIDKYLSYEQVRALLPRNIKLLWGAKPNEGGNYELYAIKTRPNEERAPLEGDVIRDARQDIENTRGISEVVVSMSMNSEGAKIWKKLTKDNAPPEGSPEGSPGKCIAIVMDSVVYTAPSVNGEIPNGQSRITGNFTVPEAKALASIIKAGKLPVGARIVQEEVVGPTLGKESVRSGLMSMVIAFIAVVLFMVLYYNTGGFVADIALTLNLLFIVGVLVSYGAALTLPGMAGIVLTLGMAVDANVIINERIREELEKGKGLRLAVADGFTASYSAIIDGNLTTLITAFVLLYYGLGPVKGFATTLVIGLICSMITAVLVARLITESLLARDRKLKFTTKISENIFRHANFDFVGKRKYSYMLSGVLTIIGFVSFFTRGFEEGVDFKGGRSYVVRFDKTVPTEKVAKTLETDALFQAMPVVKTYGSEDQHQVMITTAFMIDSTDNPKADSIVEQRLYDGVKGFYAEAPSKEKFLKENKVQSTTVGPAIADDIKAGAFKAGIFSLIAIFIYIVVRFKTWQFGLGAIAATTHDALMMLTAFSLLGGLLPFNTEVDQTFIAALLTIIGYSVNDTVVVFDRLREYIGLHPTKDFKTVINMAINSTLGRTVMTSFTVLLVTVILMIFGGEVIRGFCFALIIGIITGTYPSIFIATPIVVDLHKDKESTAKKLG